MAGIARYPELAMAGPFRATPSGYLRAAAAGGPSLNTPVMTRVVWLALARGAPVVNRYPVGSRAFADGWAFYLNGVTFNCVISTNAGTATVSVPNAVPSAGAALLVGLMSWDGATLRCRLRNGGVNTGAHVGVPSGASDPLTVGVYSGSPASTTFQFDFGAVGGFIVQNNYLIPAANEVAYLDSVAAALAQDRDVPLPDGSAGGATDWYFDARDWADPSMSWVDRINGYALPVVGAPQQSCYAGVPY